MDLTGLSAVRDRIAGAARRAGRDPSAIDLVVVTKYASDAAVRAVIADGATLLGESRADGIVRRNAEFPAMQWHFIGHLQRNKVNRVRPATAVLHSLDSVRLARAWAREGPCPPAYAQVDLAGEPQKGGVPESELPHLLETCAELGIQILGLMVIPPRGETPEDARRWFEQLRLTRDRIARDHPGVTGLSMGMSEDFEVAVEEGASVLRVGRAILEPFDDDED
jgi:pyridoxal phosphate enzyme (YggS family)